MERTLQVSVIIPISERHDDIKELYHLYADELKKLDKSFEFIFILDGEFPAARNSLHELYREGKPVRIIKFGKTFGESSALMSGFGHAKGEVILTLASYIQIEPEDLVKVFSGFEEGNELVITRRYPRKDPLVNRIQSSVYHYIIRKLTGTAFKDITSGMRLIDKKILSEFDLYGDLHRFIPIFAAQRGIRLKEVNVTQRKEDTRLRLVRPGVYLRRVLDILTVFFLVKFTKKPLRFFGLVGTALFIPGLFITIYLGILRVFSLISLSNRPILLGGILLMVFGLQMFSVGLVGELILFSHAKDIKDYNISEIIE